MENKKYTNKELWLRFLPYFTKYKLYVAFDLFCAGLTTLNELALPIILRFLTNEAITNVDNMTFDLILKVTIIFIVLKIIDIFAYYFMNNTGHVIGAMIETDMRRDIFSHLQIMSASFYSNTKIGKLMSRITNDLFDITEFAHHCPEEYFIAAIKLTVSFIILIRINVMLTMILFLMVPITFVAVNRVNKKIRKAMSDQRSHIGVLNSSIEDSLMGSSVVKSFTNEEYEINKFQEDNLDFLVIKRRMYKNLSKFHVITRIFDGLMYIIVILLGGYLLIKESIMPGDLVAYVLYISTLTATVRRIVEFTEQFHKGMSGIEKFVEIMDTKTDIYDADDAISIDHLDGNIKLENISFKYNEDEDYVLKDINLDLPAGQNIAIVGPSGGGKSTIIKLIPRFYDINSGKITIDGLDIRKIKLEDLRKQIGIVEQDVYLFSDTVLENIRYGKPDASMEEVITASKLAGADEFIEFLPDGYDTYVGERGLRLSGGQKQRISIARVFLKNPPILILDEATSALDNESERLVQASLEKLSEGRTTITIAHRLSTIVHADKIVVLTKDGVLEEGSHDELIEQKGLYYSLYSQGIKSFDD